MNPWKIALLLSYICIASISAAIITPALPIIQAYFSLSNGSLQWVVSIFLLGYVLGQLIYAPLANRYGRLKALRTGLLVNLLGILLCLFSTADHSFVGLLFGRLITALGAASGLTCTFMLINELLSKEQAKNAMSLSIISFTAGIGLSVLLGSLITEYLQWQYCFALLFIHGVAMYAFSFQFQETLQTQKPIHPKIIFENYYSAFSHRKLIIFSLVVGFVSMFSYGYSAAAPLYAESFLHLSPSSYGYWNSLNMVFMCTSGFLGAYLIKQLGETTVLKLGLIFIFPALLFLTAIALLKINNPFLFFIITSYLYLASGLLFPTASYFASNAITDRASASSAMSFINMGSAMIGVIMMGYLPLQPIVAFSFILCGFFVVISVAAFFELSENVSVNTR